MTYKPDPGLFAQAIQTSMATYRHIERGERELSLLMALRICRFYRLDLHEFISMISDEELDRPDYAVMRAKEQRERKKAEASKAKVIDIQSQKTIPL
jgi:DNA-binding XRE family transcriptional regulator